MRRALYSPALRDTLERFMGERKQAEIAAAAGCDTGALSRIVRYGRIPSREMLGRIADAMELGGRRRAELFRSAGYVEIPTEERPRVGAA